MTIPLFGDDAYLKEASAKIVGFLEESGVVLEKTIFYPTGGGQPGDTGSLEINDKSYSVQDTICLLYTSPSPRDATLSRMPSSA